MADYTTISLSFEVKEELDRQRKTAWGEVSANDFVSYLLTENAKKKR